MKGAIRWLLRSVSSSRSPTASTIGDGCGGKAEKAECRKEEVRERSPRWSREIEPTAIGFVRWFRSRHRGRPLSNPELLSQKDRSLIEAWVRAECRWRRSDRDRGHHQRAMDCPVVSLFSGINSHNITTGYGKKRRCAYCADTPLTAGNLRAKPLHHISLSLYHW